MIRVGFVIGGYPPEEHKRRADVALSYSTPEIQVGIVDVAASPYFYGMTPAEIQLVAPAFIDAFKRAEKEGYDAVVPLGTLDLGVDGGKSAVDIPVVGPTEACLACGFAHRRPFRRHGLSSKPGGIFPRHYQALWNGRSGCRFRGKRFRSAGPGSAP